MAGSPDDRFEFLVGTSMLSEFAAGHSPADVLRELVQNEYDAHGSVLTVDFGADSLTVRGTGDVIDQAGWNRLKVMVGTGMVAGTSIAVQPKVNGIGSKNFGLRSLFLFGDQISIASGGEQTVLDRRRGSLREREPHDESLNAEGVTLRVPYRSADDGDLKAFDQSREREALRDIADVLGPTLVKLAVANSKRSIAALNVSSERLNYRLTWTQTAQTLQGPGSPVLRNVRVQHSGDPIDSTPRAFREIEYTRTVLPPTQLRGRPVPSYFRVAGGRIKIGVSFELNRKRLSASQGIFYYPLGAIRARTGAQFSVNAPFAMNEDRSHLLDTANSDWNAWLLDEAATFVVDLLPSLFAQYGPAVYAAVDVSAETTTTPRLADTMRELLRSQPCWPSRASNRGKAFYAKASELTVPAPALDDVSDILLLAKVLHASLTADTVTRACAENSGAKPFTLDSLVRLRCAGTDDSGLATKDPNGARWHFPNFPDALLDLKRQVLFATAVDRARAELSPANKQDLRSTPTTLTRAGTLAAPDAPLWIIEDALAEVAPADTCLHPALAGFKVLAGLCKPFEVSRWAMEITQAAQDGTAGENAVDALRDYIFGTPTLSRSAWAAVRVAPVLLDHRDKPAAPIDLILRAAPGASELEPVLRYLPGRSDKNEDLVENLRIRDTVRGDDIVLLARAVASKQLPPSQMLPALERHAKLVTPTLVKRLESIEFLETATGDLVSPASTYERNQRTLAALGGDYPWSLPVYRRVLTKLNCRKEPALEDILRRIRDLQRTDLPLRQADSVYELLYDAARREKRRLTDLGNERLLWTGRRWATPAECLLTGEGTKIFSDAVPVLPGPREALTALGVPTRPAPSHWTQLFRWIASTAEPGRTVAPKVHESLTAAYHRLEFLPPEMSGSSLVLLDEQRTLRSRNEATARTYLINDNPSLATALRAAGAPLSFATSDPLSTKFLRGSGVASLSDVAVLEATVPGPHADQADLKPIPPLLVRLSDPDFASAASALADAICGPRQEQSASVLHRRFHGIVSIDVVDHIRRHHRVGTTSVTTDAEHLVDGNRLVIARARTQDDLRRAVAKAVANIIEPEDDGQPALADALYFLMRCRTAVEMHRELQQRRVPWTLPEGSAMDELQFADRHDEADPGAAAVTDAIHQSVIDSLQPQPPTPLRPAPTNLAPRPTPLVVPAPITVALPTLDSVRLTVATVQPEPKPKSAAGGGGAPVSWTPRTQQQADEDRALGRRGEELALRWEQDKVAKRGQDPSAVRWVADESPAANHDIVSLDADGQQIWIEVKSTGGRHGRFSWPKSEFQLAMAKRTRYYLYRVYEANTLNPTITELQDPIGRFEHGLIALDLDVFAADAGPLSL